MAIGKHDLETLKQRLEELLRGTEVTLKHLEERPDFGDDVDSFDEETDEAEEFSNRLGIKKTIKERKGNIEDALRKFEHGKYGICESCEKEIEIEVLRALPESKLCRNCKKNQK